MPGFNFTPPPGPISPMQNLQQMALQAFRAPSPMAMGGMQSPGMGQMAQPQQQQGFGAAQGAGMLGSALDHFRGWGSPSVQAVGPQGSGPGGAYTQGDATGYANMANYGMSPTDTGYMPAYKFLDNGGGGS